MATAQTDLPRVAASNGLGSSHHAVSLLDVLPELGEALDGERASASRVLTARGCQFAAGPVDVAAGGWPDTTFALLLVRGGLVHQTRAATGRMIAFLSSGDVLMPFTADPYDLSGEGA